MGCVWVHGLWVFQGLSLEGLGRRPGASGPEPYASNHNPETLFGVWVKVSFGCCCQARKRDVKGLWRAGAVFEGHLSLSGEKKAPHPK